MMEPVKRSLRALDGNGAVAEAMRQINPDVVAAYPITPSTAIPETFAEFVADGRVDTVFVPVESEHSAMSACIGAAAAGGRVMTATASAGLALMWEVLYVASGSRLPIVMAITNRALSAPINIHCDHGDSMGARDAGWIQLFAEDAQEAYDNVIQAFRIAEHADVRLPLMVMQDGFITSHSLERVTVYDDAAVRAFVGPYEPQHPLLDVAHPVTYGPLDFYDYYFEHKRQQVAAMARAEAVIGAVGRAFGERFGRTYGFCEPYRLEDAEVALVVLSSTAGTARAAVDRLREQGVPVGLLKLRVFRPFPATEIAALLGGLTAVGVMDRSVSFGAVDSGGPLWLEVVAAVSTRGLTLPAIDYVFGLGGRDITVAEIEGIYRHLLRMSERGERTPAVHYVGVRGEEAFRGNGHKAMAVERR